MCMKIGPTSCLQYRLVDIEASRGLLFRARVYCHPRVVLCRCQIRFACCLTWRIPGGRQVCLLFGANASPASLLGERLFWQGVVGSCLLRGEITWRGDWFCSDKTTARHTYICDKRANGFVQHHRRHANDLDVFEKIMGWFSRIGTGRAIVVCFLPLNRKPEKQRMICMYTIRLHTCTRDSPPPGPILKAQRLLYKEVPKENDTVSASSRQGGWFRRCHFRLRHSLLFPAEEIEIFKYWCRGDVTSVQPTAVAVILETALEERA